MRLASVQAGDVVLADRKGRRFYAVVTGRGERELEVEPIDRRVTYHRVKAHEVAAIWNKRGRPNRSTATRTSALGSSDEAERRHGTMLVVEVNDELNQSLTGRVSRSYESPPQPREQALTLAQVLLGCSADELDGEEQWSRPVAGGRRRVTLKPR